MIEDGCQFKLIQTLRNYFQTIALLFSTFLIILANLIQTLLIFHKAMKVRFWCFKRNLAKIGFGTCNIQNYTFECISDICLVCSLHSSHVTGLMINNQSTVKCLSFKFKIK